MKHSAEDVQAATDAFRGAFPRGARVTTLQVHVSRAGVRSVRILKGQSDGTVADLTWAVARILGWRLDDKNGGVKVTGVNVDAGNHVVHTIAHKLYGSGYALTQSQLY